MKFAEQQQAVVLRQSGHTYPEIAQQLNVSKSTLSRWLQTTSYQPTEKTRACRQLDAIAGA